MNDIAHTLYTVVQYVLGVWPNGFIAAGPFFPGIVLQSKTR